MQTQDNQNIVDSIMANVQNWNYNPYKAQTPTGGSLSLNGNNAFKGGISLSGGGEFTHNPFKNSMFDQKLTLGQNQLGTQTQGVLPNKVEPQTWWEKTKDFAGTGLGRSLIATGLTGALTAAFGGSPLEAVSYGAQAGGTASNVFANKQHQQDKLKQDQAEMQQRSVENELNRQFESKKAELEYLQSLATLAAEYEQKKDLENYKAGIADKAAIRNRAYALEDRDYTTKAQKESQQRGFEHDMTMAGINQVYDIERAKETLNNQKQLAIFNGDIDKALAIHQMGLDLEKNIKLKQEEARINAAQPTDKMKNYDYFMGKNEPDLARGITRNNPSIQDPSKQFERETKLRTEYDGLARIYRQAKDQYNVFNSAISSATPAGDMASIFAFMKILDPDSVVREGEYAAAAKTSGMSDRIVNYISMVESGEKLTPQQRKDFQSQVQKMMQSRNNEFEKTTQRYRDIAQGYGLNVNNIIDPRLISISPDFSDISGNNVNQNAKETLIENDPLGIR